MANRYFILTNSNNSLSKRFRVILNNYSTPLEKKGKVETTLDEELDVHRGGVYKRFDYTIKVRETEPETDYGDLEDLRTFFSYNDPNGTPSDILQLEDHHGNIYNVATVGVFDPVPAGVVIEGVDAWFFPRIQFHVLSAVSS